MENKPTLWQRYKKFVWTYLRESPWYLWVLRITAAILIAYLLIKTLNL